MKIKWNERGKEKTKDLQTIIEDRSLDYERGALESVERKASDIALFIANTVELLYKKGLLAKEDVKSLLVDFDYFYGDIEIMD